jgi:hypothetical protein
MKCLSLTLGFVLSLNSAAIITQSNVPAIMTIGEELVYEVRWAFVKLGKIRVVVLPSSSSHAAYSAIAYTDSYDLPFVDFHAVSTAEMDSTLFSKGASHYENKDGNGFKQIYRFDPSTRNHVTETAIVKDVQASPLKPPTFDTLRLSYDRFHDGTSILYYTRAHVRDQLGIRVPTLVRGKAGYTNLYFPVEQTTEEIDAVPHPISVLEFDGLAEFEGIFGLTGEFTGWFSDDEAAIPIKAKMKVILGSITLELKEWKRAGWSPPAAR